MGSFVFLCLVFLYTEFYFSCFLLDYIKVNTPGCLYQIRSGDTDVFPYNTDSADSVVVYSLPLFNGKRCLTQGWEWIEPLLTQAFIM